MQTLAFNPVKLLCLVGWVYLCLYIVQRIQFSSLVPKKYKLMANIFALFAGPIVLFVLIVIDTVKKASAGHGNIMEIIKGQLKSIRSLEFLGASDNSSIQLFDSSGTELKEIYGHGKGQQQDSHILDLTEQIISNALEQQASDILIDPKDGSSYTIRLRVDGILRTVKQLESDTCKAIINSIKAVSGMDIAERRRPQDGAFAAKTDQRTASFRVTSAGVVNGEKLSVRVLNSEAGMFTLTDIGLSQKQCTIIKDALNKPAGMILICGPTGSGKTTTMYAMLNEIDLFTHNVITVEDPIECVLPSASQIEVNPKADITFSKSLRSILRQDPDVICVGEIRDEETASIALRASQTGHLVLATVHSSSNASALVRLLDLGVTPLLLSLGLDIIVSQRLLRLLCNNCKIPAQLSPSQIQDFRKKLINYKNIFQAKGCKQCNATGYRGRTAVCDILILNDQLKTSIANSELLISQLRSEGDRKGKSNLRKQGLRKVVSGMTSLEELKRVIG